MSENTCMSHSATISNTVVIITGGATLALALMVLLGWHTHNNLLVQVSPAYAPMQYNTAMGFLLCGVGLLATAFDWRRLVMACGVLVLVIGLLTLIEYISATDLGIDQLLMKHYIMVKTSHPGRMAPNTAVCFVLSGVALLTSCVSVRLKQSILNPAILGSIVLSISIASLIGYLSGIETAYGWVSLTDMAVHTASGFIVVSIGIIAFSLSQRIEAETGSLNHTMVVGVCTLTLVIILWQALLAHEQIQMEDAIQAEADNLSVQIQQSLNSHILALDRMARRWEFESAHNTLQTRDKWEADANNYLLHQPELQAIAWADPSFHIRRVVPLQGNEELQGLDLTLEEKQRVLVRLAFTSRATVISRTIELIQGGIGNVVYVPLFNEDNFDGLIVGMFHTRDLFDSLLSDEFLRGYSIKIFDGNEEIYSQYDTVEQPSGQLAQSAEITFYNTRWQLRIWPRSELAATMASNLPTLVLTGGVIITLLLMISAYLTMTTRLRSRDILLAKQALEAENAERKRAEEKLTLSEQRLRLHREQMPLGIVEWNTDFEFVDWNPATEKIFGYTKQEVLGRPIIDFLIPESATFEMDKIISQLLSKTGGEHSINENITKDGKIILCEWYNTALVDENGKVIGITATIEDITHKKEMEDQLRRSQKMDAVGQLAGGIAHDFNNLLGIIQGNFELLQDFNIKDEKFQQWIDTGLKTVQRGASLTRRLLSFSRPEPVGTKTVHINESIAELKGLIAKSLTPKIKVELKLREDVWHVNINTGEFQDALVNLALNSRDAMPDGGTLQIATSNKHLDEDDIKIHPELEAGNYVMISISDTGCGMDKATLEQVFEPFFTTKEVDKGSGLGLSMVYGFARRSRGYVKFYSEVGHGTTVRLYLPMVNRREEERDESNAEEKVMPGGTELILAVDDEPDILQGIKHRLESLGYQVLTAENGHEALEVINSHQGQIDLLFSDVVMPGGMSGYELVQEVKEIDLDIKVLLASGFTNIIPKKTDALNSHLKVMEKPYTKMELATRVRDVLESG